MIGNRFYGVTSINLGELIEHGLDLYELEWDYYNEEQYNRLTEKIIERFYYRDIGIIPVARWIRAYKRKLNEIMPKYKELYKMRESDPNIFSNEDRYGKSRDIFSEFPATMLGDNQDYASTGNDKEYEEVVQGDYLKKYEKYATMYEDIDVLILNEMESLFSCLMTVNINV